MNASELWPRLFPIIPSKPTTLIGYVASDTTTRGHAARGYADARGTNTTGGINLGTGQRRLGAILAGTGFSQIRVAPSLLKQPAWVMER